MAAFAENESFGASLRMNLSSQSGFSAVAAELSRRLIAQGISTTGWRYHPSIFGCWEFQAQKGAESIEVFWDAKDSLLEIRRLVESQWKLDTVHPLDKTREQMFAVVEDLVVRKFQQRDAQTST